MTTKTTERTALLVMDVQVGIVERVKDQDAYLALVKKTIDTAHQMKVAVLFVVVGFREGTPEIHSNNKMFDSIKDGTRPGFINPQPIITPTGDDLVITKRRVSAFGGSDLEILLRAKNIDHLVLGGVATGGVVLSTLREAADKDYQITVLSDLCADSDDEVNTVLLNKVFPRQATVMTSEEWTKQLMA